MILIRFSNLSQFIGHTFERRSHDQVTQSWRGRKGGGVRSKCKQSVGDKPTHLHPMSCLQLKLKVGLASYELPTNILKPAGGWCKLSWWRKNGLTLGTSMIN